MDRSTNIPEILDQAIQMCRRAVRPITSSLVVIYLINIALASLVQSFLNPLGEMFPGWLLPSALGNLPAVLSAMQGSAPALVGLGLLDLLVVQSCCHALLIPLFAQHYRAIPPIPGRTAHRLSAFVQLLIPGGVLLGLTGLGTLLTLAVLPHDFIFALLVPANSGPAILRTLLALVLFSIVAQMLYSRLYLAPYVVVLEGVHSMGSLRRSWRLTEGAWWRATSIVLLTQGLIYLLATFPAVLLVTSPFTGWDVEQLAILELLSMLPATFFSIVAVPVHIAASTLLYYDLRVRREGYDLERQLHSQVEAATE